MHCSNPDRGFQEAHTGLLNTKLSARASRIADWVFEGAANVFHNAAAGMRCAAIARRASSGDAVTRVAGSSQYTALDGGIFQAELRLLPRPYAVFRKALKMLVARVPRAVYGPQLCPQAPAARCALCMPRTLPGRVSSTYRGSRTRPRPGNVRGRSSAVSWNSSNA